MRRQAKLESARDDLIMITRYETGAPDMPAALRRCVGAGGESTVALMGDPGILDRRLLGYLCAVRGERMIVRAEHVMKQCVDEIENRRLGTKVE